MSPPRLVAHDLHLAYGGRDVVHGVDLAVPPGRVTVIVGANGSGKSTLLKGLGRLLAPRAGRVELDGVDLRRVRPRELARVLGLLPQHPLAPEGLGVAALVARGRFPHRGLLARGGAADDDAVTRALAATDLLDLAGARIEELSGGQRQRAWLALLLAQDPAIMLLDEPTTFLDLAHQVDLLDLLATRNREAGTTVVMVLHDLSLAARYADHLVVMRAGRVLRAGAPGEVLDEECVEAAFGLRARVLPDPETGTPLVVPRVRQIR
ncbi:ABC transporter ATP-binding protein [Nocardioides sp. TRM66260-LWL]|uniref:ABC transporter ATP-binding protein n=1 Tax=Nocardioides sp. TRM66260-LWL TaxID=2874478 RepID=UPI001CC36E53|nr:ABC transporter ATP-binding protein [Nocardioides sp. TRM66260-LWL]MBZ5733101.1 ABC transporter ATP-binding protein [Nocardioides sp. TRM66260-LWL]